VAGTNALARPNGAPTAGIVEQVVLAGDLSHLSAEQRVRYYTRTCESLGLNPLTQPFQYLNLNGRLVLYCTRAATDQLRALHRVSLAIVGRENVGGVYVVTARATTPDGRTDEAIGAVPVDGLRGEQLANALMKAVTKAKRRVTLAIVGLGWLDESEVGSVPDAEPVELPGPQPAAGGDAPAAAAGAPAWAETPLGRQVVALADALAAAGKRVSLPPDGADEQALKGWISSKRALLAPAAR
jgi:hypothetical protein